MGIRPVYYINIQCNKVKVIVTYFHASVILMYILKPISWINASIKYIAVCLYKQLLKEGWASGMFITSTFSVIRSSSLWSYFLAPAILPKILKTISWINNTWNIGSVWHHDWQHNKCRSPWPIFHGPVLLPYILNVNWCMNIIIWDYELVWSNSWPKSKCRSLWPIFHSPVILCFILKIIWCITIIFWDIVTYIS